MPAAAVIPAPIVHANVVAVKKLVVGCRRWRAGSLFGATGPVPPCSGRRRAGALNQVSARAARFTLKKSECSRQA